MKRKMIAILLIATMAFAGIVGYLFAQEEREPSNGLSPGLGDVTYTNLERFDSFQGIQSFLVTNDGLSGGYYSYNYISGNFWGWGYNSSGPIYRYNDMALGAAEQAAESDGDGNPDHSTTNVQVEGVDEGDIIKNDGKYAYIVSSDGLKVFIVEVYPPEDARVLSIIEIEGEIIEIYLSGDKLLILARETVVYDYPDDGGMFYYPYNNWADKTLVKVFDIKDKENPKSTRSEDLNGGFVSSRLIGDYVYLIARQYANQIDNESELPIPANEIYYTDIYDYYYTYTSIISINVQDAGEEPNIQVVLMGSSTHIYVSTNNIYLTYMKRMSWVEKLERKVDDVIIPIMPWEVSLAMLNVKDSNLSRAEELKGIDEIVRMYVENLTEDEWEDLKEVWFEESKEFEGRISLEIEKTIIHRVAIKSGRIRYSGSGGVPGYILNRFSMSEHQEYFRIATTTGHVSRSDEGTARNHVFVLDMDLNIVGRVVDIAPGERIYSARFMGNRAYLVTFDKVDPFFVIDLKNPEAPKILGELKIPGYSDYLHPYDENHVIGLGKDTVLAEEGTFSWYQGVKLSLFDVTDVNNPKEVSKYIIGDRGTYSLAQHDPHAFLFSRDKNLLVLPLRLHEIDESKYPDGAPPYTHGDFVWEGAYVFHVSSEDGFVLKGKITHSDGDPENTGWWGWYGDSSIRRSFYINDVLYTVSNSMIKANSLNDLREINNLLL